jgi:hypothetical protein
MRQAEIYVFWTSYASNYSAAMRLCLKGIAVAEKSGNKHDKALLFLNLANICRLKLQKQFTEIGLW